MSYPLQLYIYLVSSNGHSGLFCFIVILTLVCRICIAGFDLVNRILWFVCIFGLTLVIFYCIILNILMISPLVLSAFFYESLLFHALSLMMIFLTNISHFTAVWLFLLHSQHFSSPSALLTFSYIASSLSTGSIWYNFLSGIFIGSNLIYQYHI